jgi:hypothetical protein
MVLFISVKEKKSKKVGNKGAGLIFCVNSVQGKRFKDKGQNHRLICSIGLIGLSGEWGRT